MRSYIHLKMVTSQIEGMFTCYPTFFAVLQPSNIVRWHAGDSNSLVQSSRAGKLYQGDIMSVALGIVVSGMHNNSLYLDILFSAYTASLVVSSHPRYAKLMVKANRQIGATLRFEQQ